MRLKEIEKIQVPREGKSRLQSASQVFYHFVSAHHNSQVICNNKNQNIILHQ